jgi:hypothetical protein
MLFYPKEVFSVVVIGYNRKGAVGRSGRYGDIRKAALVLRLAALVLRLVALLWAQPWYYAL